jgi:hypothetical protein
VLGVPNVRTRIQKSRHCTHCDVERPFHGRKCLVCGRSEPRASKYGAVPTRDASGAMRQSKLEADYGSLLHAAEQAGTITELESQVKYSLDLYGTPAVDELLMAIEDSELWKQSRWVQGLVRAVRMSKAHVGSYVLDFRYRETATGLMRYEDPKGAKRGAAYRMFEYKQRLMRLAHGINVVAVHNIGLSPIRESAPAVDQGHGTRCACRCGECEQLGSPEKHGLCDRCHVASAMDTLEHGVKGKGDGTRQD